MAARHIDPAERKQRTASLLLKMSISRDGYVASPDGSGGWTLAGRSDDASDRVVETVSNAAHPGDPATHAAWAAYWAGASGPFAEPMNEVPQVVFSNSLRSADWGETMIAAGPGRHHHTAQAGAPRG